MGDIALNLRSIVITDTKILWKIALGTNHEITGRTFGKTKYLKVTLGILVAMGLANRTRQRKMSGIDIPEVDGITDDSIWIPSCMGTFIATGVTST